MLKRFAGHQIRDVVVSVFFFRGNGGGRGGREGRGEKGSHIKKDGVLIGKIRFVGVA